MIHSFFGLTDSPAVFLIMRSSCSACVISMLLSQTFNSELTVSFMAEDTCSVETSSPNLLKAFVRFLHRSMVLCALAPSFSKSRYYQRSKVTALMHCLPSPNESYPYLILVKRFGKRFLITYVLTQKALLD